MKSFLIFILLVAGGAVWYHDKGQGEQIAGLQAQNTELVAQLAQARAVAQRQAQSVPNQPAQFYRTPNRTPAPAEIDPLHGASLDMVPRSQSGRR